eukprot:m51a1_g11502 putative 60S ribosomal protein L6 (191) ;mRNA; r:5476-6350
MKSIREFDELPIPKGVTVSVSGRVATVSGPRGKLVKNFRHIQNLSVQILGAGKKRVRVEIWFGDRRSIAAVRTVITHIKNMILGVTKGFEYKMRFVYAHFPINASVSEGKDEIKLNNFLGEKMQRTVKMLPGVTVTRSDKVKDEIVLTGNDIEAVSHCAAHIHDIALVPGGKDIRKFLDGVYVSEKHVME